MAGPIPVKASFDFSSLNFSVRQSLVVAIDLVEHDGELPHRRITAPLDIQQDVLDCLANFLRGVLAYFDICAPLGPLCHKSLHKFKFELSMRKQHGLCLRMQY